MAWLEHVPRAVGVNDLMIQSSDSKEGTTYTSALLPHYL